MLLSINEQGTCPHSECCSQSGALLSICDDVSDSVHHKHQLICVCA